MKSNFLSAFTAFMLGLMGFGLGAFFVVQYLDPAPSAEAPEVTPMSVPSQPFKAEPETAPHPVHIEEIEHIANLEENHSHDDEIHEETEAVIYDVAPETTVTKSTSRFNDESEVRRLMSRVDQAAKESVLHEHRVEFRHAIENATVVERIHNVTFNSANPHLDHRDETYLVSALQNSAAMRHFKTHPDSKLLVFGYASKDTDKRNKFFALNRAQSAEHAVEEHRNIIGFEGIVKSWCVGETDILSRETDEHCSQHNRAAELWLIVSDDHIFDEIESDEFLETTIRESGHGHKDDHH